MMELTYNCLDDISMTT